jgi:hypothetical protein
MRATERIRGLHFRKPIDFRIENRAAMRQYVHRALVEGGIELTRRRYVALGLVPAGLDIARVVEELLEQELVGYYDTSRKRLVLRDDLAATLIESSARPQRGAVEETLVHELVHALQDQNLDLAQRLQSKRSTDQENAYAAVVEGDAQLVAYAFAGAARGLHEDPDPTPLIALGRLPLDKRAEGLSAAMQAAPPFVRIPLLFRYRNGLAYVAALHLKGGFGSVDRAHRSPPATSAEILERSGDARPHVVERRSPAHSCVAASGFRHTDTDSLGALEVAVAAELAPHDAARVLRDDHYTVYASGPQIAAIWTLRTADSTSAARLSGGLERSISVPSKGVRRIATQDAEILVVRGLSAECTALLTDSWFRSP